MGQYINPTDRSKEDFLREHGASMTDEQAIAQPHRTSDGYVVCWLNNGAFTAAGIAYDEREKMAFLRGFIDGTDPRPHRFYRVPDEHVVPFLEPGYRDQ